MLRPGYSFAHEAELFVKSDQPLPAREHDTFSSILSGGFYIDLHEHGSNSLMVNLNT